MCINNLYISHTTIDIHLYEHHVYYYGNSIAIVLLFRYEEDITGII